MASSTVTAPLSSLTGVIERITFHSEESGYTVARLNTGNVQQLITIVGSFANLQAGQTLQLQGQWREHPQYGSQFQVVSYKETKPATLTGIEKYPGMPSKFINSMANQRSAKLALRGLPKAGAARAAKRISSRSRL